MSIEPLSPATEASAVDPAPLRTAAALIRQWSETIQRFAQRETELAAQRVRQRQEQEQAQQGAEANHLAWVATEQQELRAEHQEQLRHAETRFRHAEQGAQQQLEQGQVNLQQVEDQALQAATQLHQEARWEAESLLATQREAAQKQLTDIQGQVQTACEIIEAQFEFAENLLATWRQPSAALRESAPVIPNQSAEWGALLNQELASLNEASERLGELRLPSLLVQPGMLLGFPLLALLAAGCVGFLGGGGLGFALTALGLGVALVVWYFLLRGRARAQVAEIVPGLFEHIEKGRALSLAIGGEAQQHFARRMQESTQRCHIAMSRAERQREEARSLATAQHKRQLEEALADHGSALAQAAQQRDRDRELAHVNRQRNQANVDQQQADWEQQVVRYHQQLTEFAQRTVEMQAALAQEKKDAFAALRAQAEELLAWGPPRIDSELAPSGEALPVHSASTGYLRVGSIPTAIPQQPSGGPTFELPALVSLASTASLLFRTPPAGRTAALGAIQAYLLRLLLTLPPGKVRLTLFDPVGLGENFAGFMHLADYQESLVTSRIWTEGTHFEQRLADLSEHMENVIQKYLRNEFESIQDYNRDAGEIAEPYRFLVVADFPTNFSDKAQQRLLSIATSGARCGVYTVVLLSDQAKISAPMLNELQASATVFRWKEGKFLWRTPDLPELVLKLDAPPSPAVMTEWLRLIGEQANRAARVEVPFERIAPLPEERWAFSAQRGLEVPLGRSGATRLQALRLGQGTSQHVLIAGKTGSGKSTLLHALIVNAALRFSPDELDLYLIDFKQGIEFKAYARFHLPHARVVAIESDREFGLSVLQRLDQEIKLRADRFRTVGAQDLAAFRQAEPQTLMPRILLIVDEFQEFFVEDDRIAQDTALLLDRLVRQGRAFGIHVLLGSQTLAGAYSLARSTIGQMAVRIALQCSETDAHLILSEDNSAARLLQRAGEAIYNDQNGLVEGNHPFQVVWLPEQQRESYLQELETLAATVTRPLPQVVFEGNALAILEDLPELFAPTAVTSIAPPTLWLGESVTLKGASVCKLRRQSGENLLVVGQNESQTQGLFAAIAIALVQQTPAQDLPLVDLIDSSSPDSPTFEMFRTLASALGRTLRRSTYLEVDRVVNELAQEVERRLGASEFQQPPRYLLLHGVQRLRQLRKADDDFSFSRATDQPPSPSKQLVTILRDGPAVGIHCIAWCDQLTNLSRTWDRTVLREFALRIAFQMSGGDSSTFLDSPLAAKLGPFRALLQNEAENLLEKFRPYRWPGDDWLALLARRFASQTAGPMGE